MKKEKKVATGDFIETQNQPVEKQKDVKKTKKNKKPGLFKRIGMKMKDVFSELKKVAWPKFPKVVKQTGVVFAVVIVFLVVITAFDFGLMELLKLIAPRG
jgi:preprotein translocase SecE subunit